MKKLVRFKKTFFFIFYIELLISKSIPPKCIVFTYYHTLYLNSVLYEGETRNVLRVYTYTDLCTVKSKFEDTR